MVGEEEKRGKKSLILSVILTRVIQKIFESCGDKLEVMLEQFCEVDVGTRVKVRMPKLEHKLARKEMSRAEMLKMKLKQ